jgi:phosphate uptake regulator
MWKELKAIFRSNDAIAEMGESFSEMLETARELTLSAGEYLFESPSRPDEPLSIAERDIALNKLQRRIRKQVIAHLTVGNCETDTPYGLLLMSLVKDVERIGDYCKNIGEIYQAGGAPIPDDEVGAELREIRAVTEDTFESTLGIFDDPDTSRATRLLEERRALLKRCDALIPRIVEGAYDGATTTTLILGVRYYKRIHAHLLNVISGVVMPLHKLDYFDERELPDRAPEEDDEA